MLSKVREVFTKEYREETEYREFADTMDSKSRKGCGSRNFS